MFTRTHPSFLTSLVAFFLVASVAIGTLVMPVSAVAGTTGVTSAMDYNNLDAKAEDFGCSAGSLSTAFAGCVAFGMYTVMKFCGAIAGYVGILLNYSLSELVVGMSTFVATGQQNNVSIVEVSWTIIRDVVNVFLVFLAIFIGIATIVGISGYGYKQLLWKVVLAAVFVNFSITLAYFVIDITNYTAMTIYMGLAARANPNMMGCIQPQAQINPAYGSNQCITNGIAGAFLTELKLVTLLSGDGLQIEPSNEKSWRIALIALFGSIFLLILAFVLGASAFLLIGRFIILLFLVIISPLGLVLWITGVSRAGTEWWSKLLNQSLIAPAMLLMFYLSWRLMNVFAQRFTNDTMANALGTAVDASAGNGDMTAMSILLFFAVAAGFLIASLVLARSLGAAGANAVMNTGRSMARGGGIFIGGMTVGMVARGGRRVIGGAADRISESQTLKDAVSNPKTGARAFVTRNLARGVRNTAQKTTKASFDARGVLGMVGAKEAQKWVGTGKKGGYAAIKKEGEERIKNEHKWVTTPTETKHERQQRDEEITKIGEAFSKSADLDVMKTAGDNLNEVTDELKVLNQQLTSTTDPAQKAQLEQKRDALTQKSYQLENFQSNVKTQRNLRTELSTGVTRNPDGTTRALTGQERQEKEQQLKTVTNNIRSDYGLVDSNVDAADKNMAQLQQKALAETDKKKKEKIQEQVNALAEERQALVDLHETNREFVEAQAVGETSPELKQRVQEAKDALQKVQARKSQAVDKAFDEKRTERAQARGDAYINYASTEKTAGVVPTPAWKRDAAMKLRKPTGKAKRVAEMEQWIKDIEKEEKAGGGTESSSSEGGEETPKTGTTNEQ